MTPTDLATRIEALDGPDREIDAVMDLPDQDKPTNHERY